jgi:hypothetical protein
LKFALGVLAGVLALFAAIIFAPRKRKPLDITLELEDKKLNEREEAKMFDDIHGGENAQVDMHPIHLGDLSIPCPLCDTEVDLIQVGMGSVEDRDSGEGDFNEVVQLGVIYYLCGHVIYSPCLVDKVATILNAEDIGKLAPKLFDDLHYCKTHMEHQDGD